MNLLSPRLFPLFAVSVLALSSTPSALGAAESDGREVRVSFVQGDVRLSRGNGKGPDLNKPWEQAQAGESIEQGFALATGDGRAEIAFEGGSTVFLAGNSLLLFNLLSAPGDLIVTSMTLATGTATFDLRPVNKESFFIQTPMDGIEVAKPDAAYMRIDAYLDATAITPQGEMGERLVRGGRPRFQLEKGQTTFFCWGEIVGHPDSALPALPAGADQAIAASLREDATKIAALRATGFFPVAPSGLIPQSVSSSKAAQGAIGPAQAIKQVPLPATGSSRMANDWDAWVSTRVQEESSVMTAALKASGLSSPIPGLTGMYEHGSFFNCGEYGTCWEPSQTVPEKDEAQQSSVPHAQSPTAGQTSAGFQPQTVEWNEPWETWCGLSSWRRISRLARTPEELPELLRQKEMAENSPVWTDVYSAGCYNGYWFRHQRHYVKVITPRHPPKCTTAKCKPGHPPRPVWVRAGNKAGFVPRHPMDVDGKPPLNLKHGMLVPPSKAGQPVQLVTPDSSRKITVLNKEPKQFQSAASLHAPAVSAPPIRASFMPDKTRESSLVAANRQSPPITYNYRTQKFMTSGGGSVPGAKSKEVAVGGLAPNGRVSSYAGGNSRGNGGGGHGSGSYSSGSHNSGGEGRSSGSSSSGGSSGSHSSGSSSSGGSSSHSSSGGGGSSSSGGSSSASSSSSAGGGSHH